MNIFIKLATIAMLCCTSIPLLAGPCDGLQGTSNLYGLCNAYCVAKKCNIAAQMVGSVNSCNQLRDNFAKQGSKLDPPLTIGMFCPVPNDETVSFSVVKLTNGSSSTDLTNPPLNITVGNPVGWTYDITNTGTTNVVITSIHDVNLSSNTDVGTITCTPVIGSTLLPSSSPMHCVGPTGALATLGTYENQVTVHGTNTGGANGIDVSAMGGYVGVAPVTCPAACASAITAYFGIINTTLINPFAIPSSGVCQTNGGVNFAGSQYFDSLPSMEYSNNIQQFFVFKDDPANSTLCDVTGTDALVLSQQYGACVTLIANTIRVAPPSCN